MIPEMNDAWNSVGKAMYKIMYGIDPPEVSEEDEGEPLTRFEQWCIRSTMTLTYWLGRAQLPLMLFVLVPIKATINSVRLAWIILSQE